MNSAELYRLGRRLTALARAAMADPDDPTVSAGETAVIDDVLEHPDSAVQEITARTGFAQSYVSATVARLREKGWVETAADPTDRRRTLVRLPDLMVQAIADREGRPLDEALAAALPALDTTARAEVLALLDALARQVLPAPPHRRGAAAGPEGRRSGRWNGAAGTAFHFAPKDGPDVF